jgi:3-methylcrotonyl-CoA carboxylase alpha subunit
VMRRVNAAGEFQEMLLSCKREAASSFGDDRVLIEKYIERPLHIEVQVFGDSHGNVVHLFERDCSLQRRHQKVIEEAPAPGMDEATRAAVCAAAVKAAKAVDYVGAGTIEFIADASEGLRADRIWFMEMNTRLQVEHPVTEEITGQDLVEWQLRVASGETLPKRQDELAIKGWAMEARLYAEDPTHDFLPSIGPLERFAVGGHNVRVDTGVEEGGRISSYYDPMIAKLIAHGRTREEAIRNLANACNKVAIWPVKSNAGFLYLALRSKAFGEAEIDTGFIARHWDSLMPSDKAPDDVQRSAAVQAIHSEVSGWPQFLSWISEESSPLPHPHAGNVWREALGFRLNGEKAPIEIRLSDDRYDYLIPLGDDLESHTWTATPYRGGVIVEGARGQTYVFHPWRAGASSTAAAGDGAIISPMPGKLIAVEVRQGDAVTKGQKLVTLEAMKMEHSLSAPFDGIVAELNASEGAQVSEGALLARIEKEEG